MIGGLAARLILPIMASWRRGWSAARLLAEPTSPGADRRFELGAPGEEGWE